MRRFIPVLLLLAAGCGSGSDADTSAAEKFVRRQYSNVEMAQLQVYGPEYAAVTKVPDSHRAKPPDRAAASAVRVRFTWREENRTTHDDWLVWVSSDHEAVDWSGNPKGDDWRQYVRSLAK